MDQTASIDIDDMPPEPVGAEGGQSAFFADRSKQAIRLLGMLVTLAAVIVTSGSFLLLTGTIAYEPSPEIWTVIWIVNGVLVLVVIALVVTEATLLIQARMRKQAGAGLQIRMVAMFAVAAAVPAALVAVVATIAINQGLDQWFSDRTKVMVESSRLVARSYMAEHAQVLRDDIIWVATELEQAKPTYDSDKNRFQRILTALAVTRSLPFTSLITADGETIMRAQINAQGAPPRVPAGLTTEVVEGVPTFIAPGRSNLVGSVVKLRGYEGIFLFVARPVDAEVLEYMRLTDDNFTDYREYASNRIVFQITFTIMYVGMVVVLLLAALWIGISLANRFVDPIRNLMIASNRVSRGDLDVLVPVQSGRGDLRDLGRRFNRMTEQLRAQREALVGANAINEKRRQFTEAVVEGVSAGIVGLDSKSAVNLVNARAAEMFGRSEIELMGEKLDSVVPELTPILDRARSARRGQMRDQIHLGPEQNRRTYQVQVTREGTLTESKGFVVTLDDVTDFEAAQRTSAWADVARRIAHEIKNPLTPIQLSAERLRRRYGERLEGDREVFDKCINTIVRQVGDIGRMVDEFSAFARMPEASPVPGDLSDTVRQAVFLESVRLPEIAIETILPDQPIIALFDNRLISQCLTNLIKNGVEAFETVGINTIDNPAIIVEVQTEGRMARVSVSDNGKGWPKDNRQRLLEPYMTTREKGTGLGLAIVARIIEQHGGSVDLLDAEPDMQGRVGACFTFTLPLVGETAPFDPSGTPKTSDYAEEPRGNRGRSKLMARDILIIDDEDDIRDLIAGILEDEGYETRQAHDADSALNEIARRRPSLVFLDIWMQGSRLDGLQLLDVFQAQHPDMPVVMISGHGNVETAVSAIRRGAYDYIEKPFKIDRLLLITQRAMEATKLRSENAELRERSTGTTADMVGTSPALHQVRGLIEKSAPTNSRIFISGPSGSGKGLTARLIHQRSPRADAPFVEINTALYAPDEVGVVLFGREVREKTGLLRTEVGALERAHGGTLYLSEVTSLPAQAQQALLRMLVENRFVRIGGNAPVPIDVRIIASSSQNVAQAIEEGAFRSDLFHRLSIVPLQITPLKERREDVPPLVNVFIDQVCRMHNLQRLAVGDDAMAVLQAQDWPGNARQLRNSLERLLILIKGQAPENGVISAAMLPSDIGEVLPTVGDTDASAHLMSLPLRDAREVFERQYLLAQIERFGGNISKTAEFVGMERSALHRKIKSLGL